MNRKKIIVLFAGKTAAIDHEGWRRLQTLSGSRFDFAFSTWTDCAICLPIDCGRVVWVEQENQTAALDELEPIARTFEWFPAETKPLNTLMMWRKWHRFCACANLATYDVIIRTRPDVALEQTEIPEFADVLTSMCGDTSAGIAIPSGGDWRGGLNDVLAIGRPEAIGKYISLAQSAAIYYKRLDYFHPERFLRFHLINRHQLPVLRFKLGLYLRGKLYNVADQDARTAHVVRDMDRTPLPAVRFDDFKDLAARMGLGAVAKHGARLAAGRFIRMR